jgi:hypothetical protein
MALGLLLSLAIGSVILQPSLSDRVVGLVIVLAVFVALRRGLGNAIQRRFFMAVDFTDVSLRSVRGAPRGLLDRGPVSFVETRVRAGQRAP